MEQIAKLREAIPAEKQGEVKETLAEIESALESAQGLQDKINKLQRENKSLDESYREALQDTMKHKAIKDKATAKIDELQAEIAKHEKQNAELEDLRKRFAEQQAQELAKMRENYKSKLDGLAKHPAYDRIKDKIVLPTDENPLEKLSDEDLKKSLDKITEWEDLGLLKGNDSRTPTTGSGRDTAGDEQYKSLRKAFGLPEKKKG